MVAKANDHKNRLCLNLTISLPFSGYLQVRFENSFSNRGCREKRKEWDTERSTSNPSKVEERVGNLSKN